ncbi:hypothetical protein [Burkholderia stabilis]|uniref:hypothetical protein n=1 Tax=Burkholderia stabilis TaxID=95485 RepID=UPI001F4B27C0|nr:hypothetical protein [Burkholderia stabilis]
MKHTVEAIKTISSSADNARIIVSEFCQEALNEARMRLDCVKSIANLGTILDAAQLTIAADARAGVRHLHAAMQEVDEHHHRGALAGRFDETLLAIGNAQEEVEELYRWLHMLYTRD